MHAVDLSRSERSALEPDQRVFLHGVSWQDYERLLAMRGERSSPRISYLAGEVELMSPSRGHERLKTLIARLLEAFAEERHLPLNGFGSWTLKSEPESAAPSPTSATRWALRGRSRTWCSRSSGRKGDSRRSTSTAG